MSKYTYALEEFQNSEGGMIYTAYPKDFSSPEEAFEEIELINQSNYDSDYERWLWKGHDFAVTVIEK